MALGALMLAMGGLAACRERGSPPAPVPARLAIVADLPAAAVAGSVAGALVVRVEDEAGGALSGVVVNFSLSAGGGRVSPPADTTRADGTVSTTLTIGTVPGPNAVSATVAGLPRVTSTIVLGAAGAARTVTLSPRFLRLSLAQDSLPASAIVRDSLGNVIAGQVEWTSRNASLVAVHPAQTTTAFAHVVSRPGQTYLVASLAGVSDSIPVAVHDETSTPCSFVSAPTDLAVGGSLALETRGVACVRSIEAGEYALVAHYNTAIASGAANVSVAAHGSLAPSLSFPPVVPSSTSESVSLTDPFERELRAREARAIGPYVPAARAWFTARGAGAVASLSAARRVGDLTSINVNAFDFCDAPSTRTARVMAITDGTVMLEDTSNPAGGFSQSEYREMAAAMDTLVMPTDTGAFGAPSDIDGNGRIGILFTRAVNELTPRGGSGGVVLGFYYVRDLLPRQSAFGSCPGSNAGEMFYIIIPDEAGIVSDPRSKAFVQSVVISTIAHELQHLINASRRMYLTDAPTVNEETWLNEGLSHIAEELVFYRASGLSARQNIGAEQLAEGSATRALHDQYMRGNFNRLAQYLRDTENSSPLASNDQLATRGASWAFLRYLADRVGATDGDLWRRLVNSRETGVVNVDAALTGTGVSTLAALRDWSTSIIADDHASGLAPALSQPSWNYLTALPQVGISFGLQAPALGGNASSIFLRSGGSGYARFAVAAGKEVLVQITNGGGVAQPGVRVTIVRIR